MPPGTPIVVVVNGGPRPDVGGASVQWIEPGANLGFGAAVDLAVRALDGVERIVCVNPDCDLRPEHFDALADGHPDEVVTLPLASPVGPTTVASAYPSPIGFLLGALRARERLRRALGARRGLAPSGGLGPGASAPLTTHWTSGACWSIDRDRFLAVEGFDEGFFLYYEDTDLSRRLGQRFPQMRVRVADVAPGQHAVGGSASGRDRVISRIRLRAAGRYASRQQGAAWTVVALLVRALADRGAPTPGPTAQPDVWIVSLGRPTALGELRRVESWERIAAAAGCTSRRLDLLRDSRRRNPLGIALDLVPLARHRLVLEGLAWSPRRARRQLGSTPGIVVVVTARAYHPSLVATAGWTVLDLVDVLSTNYRQRHADATSAARRIAFRALAGAHARFEADLPDADVRTAAGRAEAGALGLRHVPNTVSDVAVADLGTAEVDHDLAFVGKLDYEPNLAAITWLDHHAAELTRPDGSPARILVAGALPGEEVRGAVARHGWTLLADFAEAEDVYRRTAAVVVPLPYATGFQNKVVDALRMGRPVVATPAAVAGLPEGAPVAVAPIDELPEACRRVLADPAVAGPPGQVATWMREALLPDAYVDVLGPRPGRWTAAP